MEQEWLGLRQVAQYASLSDRILRTWIHAPVDPLPAVRVGGKILIKKSDLDLWLERRRVKPLEAVDLDGIVKNVLQGLANGR
jgi:excisionase family DNA binding protein